VAERVRETAHPLWQLGNALDLTASLIAVGLLALSYAGESGLTRILLALAFAFFVPGRAIVTNWPRIASWSEVAMPMVLSLAVLTFLATITLWAHFWKPMYLFQVEAWLSLGGLCLGIAHREKRRSVALTRPGTQNRRPEEQERDD
jgi:uncharacterized membrane protein HdeD (DUF308 family)